MELTAEDLPVVTLGDYLENVSLLSAVDVDDEESGANRIALMTAHSSKGLEFPYVYVAGMEENIFPSGGWMASEVEIEEERRLFYVAMTRAKKHLSLSFAQTRLRNGKTESNSPSRSVREIDQNYILNPLTKEHEGGEEIRRQSFGSWKKDNAGSKPYGQMSSGRNSYGQSSRPEIVRRPQPSVPTRPDQPASPTPVRRPQTVPPRAVSADFEPTPILQLRAGQRIEHNRFGYGVIKEISGSSSDLKANILFDEHGEKILLLKYAKIRAIDL